MNRDSERPAARRVYDIDTLKRNISSQLDSYTWTVLCRLEQGATASVAEYQYEKVHYSVLENMGRETVSTLQLSVVSKNIY